MRFLVIVGALLAASCSASSPDDTDHQADTGTVDAPPESSGPDGAIGDAGGTVDEFTDTFRPDVGPDTIDEVEASHDARGDVAADTTMWVEAGIDGSPASDGSRDVAVLEDGHNDGAMRSDAVADAMACPVAPFEGCLWGDAGDAAPPDGGIPSFARDVAPIIPDRCATCHAVGNDAGLWPLGTFEEVWDWQRLIAADLIKCTMPPPAAPPVTLEERTTLFTWLYCGTPDN
jgi:hypothetical protein